MKTAFLCSLIRGGILGGMLYLDEKAVTYKTNKLTVESRFRNLILPLKTIQSVTWKNVLPVVTFATADGENFSFLLFNKGKFIKRYRELTE